MKKQWTKEEDAQLIQHHGNMEVSAIANKLGRTKFSVRARITRLGIAKKSSWTKADEEKLRALYDGAVGGGYLGLKDFAEKVGKSEANISRKAKQLGLEVTPNRKKVKQPAPKKQPKFNTDEERSEFRSNFMKNRHAENDHPMMGKTHSDDAKQKISTGNKKVWASLSEEARQYKIDKAAKAARGIGPPKVKRGRWKAQWRVIGGKRNYYRSNWEANYAAYLEWLKCRGEIQDWEHEPETFWFEAIKRGVRSYKPDFRVWENNGRKPLHEIKGWMCSRSKTTLKRMAKYYPEEEIVLIREKEYKSISKYKAMIPGWID